MIGVGDETEDGEVGYVRLETPHKGDGVFTTRPFDEGETVMAGAPILRVERNDSHAIQISRHEFGYEEGMGSIVNHSCDPNCGVRPTERGVFDLWARRPVDSGEEITVDYAMRNYVIEFFPPDCLCGSLICRSLVTGWKDLPQERRIAYEGSVAPFLYEIEHEITRQA